MTAFTTADLPPSINTVEKLVVWGNTVLNDLYPNTSVLEAVNQSEFVAQSSPFFITAGPVSQWRVISRTSIELNGQWRRTGKIWQWAIDVGSTSIPADFKS